MWLLDNYKANVHTVTTTQGPETEARITETEEILLKHTPRPFFHHCGFNVQCKFHELVH